MIASRTIHGVTENFISFPIFLLNDVIDLSRQCFGSTKKGHFQIEVISIRLRRLLRSHFFGLNSHVWLSEKDEAALNPPSLEMIAIVCRSASVTHIAEVSVKLGMRATSTSFASPNVFFVQA